jgi:hypothetical protein
MDRWAGRYLLRKVTRQPARQYLRRRFPRTAKARITIYYEADPISQAQVYPFLHHTGELHARFGAAIRCYPVKALLAGARPNPDGADVVLLQIWFDTPEAQIRKAVEDLRAAHPGAPLVFVDSFAHNDLRLGPILNDHIDFYLKKSLFVDKDLYFRPFRGDTILTEYYGDLYGIAAEPVDFKVPRSILPKLRLSPNFFTSPRFLTAFPYPQPVPWAKRALDVQTRLAVTGSPWYQAMRQGALARIQTIPGLAISRNDRISWQGYMAEMRRSRLCWSPFGYGELCWRDIEAIVAGAVLIKPDMSHLVTLPDLYEAGVTYLPVRWDFADLEEVVTSALRRPERCQEIAREAYRRMEDYALSARFVDDVAFLMPETI